MRGKKKADEPALTIFDLDDHVCRYCGSQLASEQLPGGNLATICWNCRHTNCAIKPEIFLVAAQYVDREKFKYYHGDDNEVIQRQNNISKMCEIITWLMDRIDLRPIGERLAALDGKDNEDVL